MTKMTSEPRAFPYLVDRRFLPVLAVFGFRSRRDGVQIEDDRFVARFGWFRIETSMRNIDGAHITRDYRWWTAVGARLSFVDDGLSFGTNTRAGVCVHFSEKVPSALRRRGHSAVTVTVEDVDGLVAALGSRN